MALADRLDREDFALLAWLMLLSAKGTSTDPYHAAVVAYQHADTFMGERDRRAAAAAQPTTEAGEKREYDGRIPLV